VISSFVIETVLVIMIEQILMCCIGLVARDRLRKIQMAGLRRKLTAVSAQGLFGLSLTEFVGLAPSVSPWTAVLK
jgi:hypothetical protein